ncbi:MAG TPA: ethanolamine ammonia-lyase reactivating factor EutA, partial [Hyphomicrobiaceae bacterium]|nr:ethanolamine ammonia-lyase reactivating factor EutA [Hyphomicrobiaceae bacterium]
MNIDIGGGTSKIAVCELGDIVELTAIDIGARVVCLDEGGRIARLEEAGRRFATELGLDLEIGRPLSGEDMRRIAARMADRLFEAVSAAELSPATAALIRVEPLRNRQKPDVVTFSGGVSEYVYGREQRSYGDLGAPLAAAIRSRIEAWGVPVMTPDQGIRATVVGASQYTVQVSGSTIYVTPDDALPLRNLPVIVPDLPLAPEELVPDDIARAIESALRRNDLSQGEQAVAMCFRWQGSATFRRLDDFCKGVMRGLRACLERGHPLVLVSDGDVGGLIGIHAHEEARLASAIVSIDGILLKEFDFIDIGELLAASGAVPVVIKSLVFPTSAALGRVAAQRLG